MSQVVDGGETCGGTTTSNCTRSTSRKPAMRYLWRAVGVTISDEEYLARIGEQKNHRTKSCSRGAYNQCIGEEEQHQLLYRVFSCESKSCAAVARARGFVACPWHVKSVQCQKTKVAEWYEHDQHLSSVVDPRNKALTNAMKAEINAMILNGVKPNRIRVELLDRLNLSSDTLPSLQCIQNYVSYCKRAKLSFADYVEDLQALLVDTEYHPALADHDPFTFGFSRDETGLPSIGDGSNAQPFVVGASTRKLLQVMDRPSESFVFHIDATYKLNQVGYPVVVCGVSDGGRSFHLAAIFVISQQTEEIITIVLEQLASMFEMTTNKSLKLTYVMGDADQAQHNALQAVFPECTKLMCFNHVAANVDKHSTPLDADEKRCVLTQLTRMHFSKSDEELGSLWQEIEVAWDQTQRFQAFRDYFKRQSVTSAHWRWQCYHTPIGYATTNNPAETFNKELKRDYTRRNLFKLPELFKTTILKICRHRTVLPKPFCSQPHISSEVTKRACSLSIASAFTLVRTNPMSLSFLLESDDASTSPTWVKVVHRRTVVANHTRSGRQVAFERHDQEMERYGMPETGWSINCERMTCACRVFWKYRGCVHVVFAANAIGLLLPGEKTKKRKLVNRRVSRVRGRVPRAGPALQLT